MPPEANSKRVGKTHCEVQDEALVDTLAETPIEGKAETFRKTMVNVKAKPSTRWVSTYNRRRPRQNSTEYAM